LNLEKIKFESEGAFVDYTGKNGERERKKEREKEIKKERKKERKRHS
jgi:hypothetical protein